MSSRLYPQYVKGNPQLRIFLPNFWMKLVKHGKPQPPNTVKFVVPLQMTKYDVKNYLEKIYKVPVAQVKTFVMLGKIKRAEGKGYLIKENDYRVAFVTLPQGQTFEFPDVYPEEKVLEQERNLLKQADELKQVKQRHTRTDPHRQDLPSWFGL
uniref:Large ribosomal subunit protein uL23m n=1 Tax=Ixodes ricinus TaxID=34613 RepID=A0A0K8RA45_IXORI